MTETLAQAVRVDGQQKRAIIVLICLVVFLLLLWKRKGNVTNNITKQQLGGVNVDPNYISYSVPALTVPGFGHTGQWDWMQTTDCACDCSADSHSGPVTPLTIVQREYSYVGAPALSASSPIVFPYQAQKPLPTWWYDTSQGFNRYTKRYDDAYGPLTLAIIRTSDGHWFQYDYTFRYTRAGVINQGAYNLSGDNLYYNAQRYVHDTSRDKDAGPDYYPFMNSGGAVA